MILTLTDTTRVQAQPAAIRRWLSDVENWPKINPKIKSIAAQGGRCIGMLEFKGREIEFAGAIENTGGARPIICHILFREKDGRESRLDVAYAIKETNPGAIVTESVTFLDPLPLWGVPPDKTDPPIRTQQRSDQSRKHCAASRGIRLTIESRT